MSASNSTRLALSKRKQVKHRAKPVKRLRARSRVKPMSAKRRKEQRLVAKVFAEIEPRDGHCRLYRASTMPLHAALIGICGGDPTPAHLADWRRGTCKLPPEERSNRTTIIRLCQWHHRRYDEHKFALSYGTAGGDGVIQPVPYVKGAAA